MLYVISIQLCILIFLVAYDTRNRVKLEYKEDLPITVKKQRKKEDRSFYQSTNEKRKEGDYR